MLRLIIPYSRANIRLRAAVRTATADIVAADNERWKSYEKEKIISLVVKIVQV